MAGSCGLGQDRPPRNTNTRGEETQDQVERDGNPELACSRPSEARHIKPSCAHAWEQAGCILAIHSPQGSKNRTP